MLFGGGGIARSHIILLQTLVHFSDPLLLLQKMSMFMHCVVVCPHRPLLTVGPTLLLGGGDCGLWGGGLVWFWAIWPKVPSPHQRRGGGLGLGGWVGGFQASSSSQRALCFWCPSNAHVGGWVGGWVDHHSIEP